MNVTIPAEIADVIVYLREDCAVYDDVIIRNCFNDAYADSKCRKRQVLAKFADEYPSKLASAIVNGYERELTVEERAHKEIRAYYVRQSLFIDGVVGDAPEAVRLVLDKLGIKIEGVNA